MKECRVCGRTYENGAVVCELDGGTLIEAGAKNYIGRIIKGKYHVVKELGKGGMGTVYLAQQINLGGKEVALKLLSEKYVRDDEVVRRFRQEAHLAARLKHRNVVEVYDFDEAEDGSLFIAMEYVDGGDLKDLIKGEGPLDVARAVRLGTQITEGLAAAHRAKVIHRDVKAENILIFRGSGGEEIKLTDFGIARLRDIGTSGLTRGIILGTWETMAPEQFVGGDITEKTDIYSFGLVLYEMLSGDLPFRSSSSDKLSAFEELREKHIHEQPLRLRKVRREIPSQLDKIVMQALEKEPERRPGTEKFIEELQKLGEELKSVKGPGKRFHSRPWDIMGWAVRRPRERKPERAESPTEEAREVLKQDEPALDTQDIPKTWVGTQPLTVEGVYPSKPRVPTVNWVTASLAALGIAAVIGVGIYIYIAPDKSQDSPLTQPQIVSLIIEADKKNLAPKERAFLRVRGRYSDGREQEISSGLEWQSSDISVANVNPEGQVEGQKEGVAEITARYKEFVTAPVTLVVKAEKPVAPPSPALVSLTVLAAKRELSVKEGVTLKVKGKYSDGKEAEIARDVVWQSSNEQIASVDSRGRVTAQKSGYVDLSASYEGLASPAITLIVKDSKPAPEIPAVAKVQPKKPEIATTKPLETETERLKDRLKLASLYYEEGKYQEAISELDRALKIDPESVEARAFRRKVQKAWEAEKRLGR